MLSYKASIYKIKFKLSKNCNNKRNKNQVNNNANINQVISWMKAKKNSRKIAKIIINLIFKN